MVLLALQYTLQPRLSKRYISPKTNKQSVALAEETVKTAIAAAMFCASRSGSASTATTTIQQELSNWNLQSSLAIAGIPAVLYAIQGVWQYTAHQYIDPVTFNGLSQTKTLWAAACCYLILGQSQSVPQMGALILLFVSALLFQGVFTTASTSSTATATATSTRTWTWTWTWTRTHPHDSSAAGLGQGAVRQEVIARIGKLASLNSSVVCLFFSSLLIY
jgi:UDP-sugar transporter A1/2/3